MAKVINQPGKITKVTEQKKKQAPPLPYNLSTLQIDAAKRFSMSAKQVLDVCQNLYERHKLITYPRSDSRYLPTEHLGEAGRVTEAITKTCSKLSDAVAQANLKLKSKAWNDSKVSAHHAIIPTMKSMDGNRLSRDESNIYELIARQYLIQFYLPFEYADKSIESEVSGGLFIAKQKDVLAQGWKALFPQSKKADSSLQNTKHHTNNNNQNESEGFSTKQLPLVKKGDPVTCTDANLVEKQTSPPRHFTDATLLGAMTGIARYVNDPAIKKVLRETDGIGTEATRAGIIELLFTREYLQRKGKEIHATNIGKQLITSLPESMGYPDMTAHWESQLEAICQREISYGNFMIPMTQGLQQLINDVGEVEFSGLQGLGKSPKKWGKRKKFTKKKSTVKKRA